MATTTLHPVQIAKRLVAADGYLELGMPAQALERLQPLSTEGPFGGLVSYMRGQALKAQANFPAAASALETAAQELPEPIAKQIWFELSECYRRAGFTTHAVNSLGSARGASSTPAPGAGEKL